MSAKTQVLPWVEVNSLNPVLIDEAVEGLIHWSTMTRSAIVTSAIDQGGRGASNHSVEIFRGLREKLGRGVIRIFPGLKLPKIFDFGSQLWWRLLTNAIREVLTVNPSAWFVIEAETALKGYKAGDVSLDFDELRGFLSTLALNFPKLNWVWYPGISGRNDATIDRMARIAIRVHEYLKTAKTVCRVVHFGSATPRSANDRWIEKARLASWHRQGGVVNPNSPNREWAQGNYAMVYCYGEGNDWADKDIPELIRKTKDEVVILYPGHKRWIDAAKSIAKAMGREVQQ